MSEILMPVATFEGAKTLYIYVKKTCYEYELDGGSQSQVLTEDPSANPCTTSLLALRSMRAYNKALVNILI